MEEIEQLAAKMDRNTVLFIGSGASSPAGLPSWWELVNWLRDYTSFLGGDINAADVFLAKNQLINATSALTSQLNKIGKSLADFFNEEPKCEIFTSATPKDIHQLIAQLPTSSIITPNYDLLLEKTFDETGKPMEMVYKGDNDRINSILRNTIKDYIYKYHGCITKPDDIIFDFKQYNAVIHTPNIDKECLRTLIQTKTIVFIGAGLDDPDFNHIRDYLNEIATPKNMELWAFMRDCELIKEHYKEEFGINLISYAGQDDDHSDLLTKLKDLILRLNDEDGKILDALEIASPLEVERKKVEGLLRDTLLQVNEEVMPLDEAIIGFIGFFDTVEKNTFFQYFHDRKGHQVDEISNRVEYLIQNKLIKATENYLMPMNCGFSQEAAEQMEEEILDYMMEQENG